MPLDENQRRKPRITDKNHFYRKKKAEVMRNIPYLITMDEYLSSSYSVFVLNRWLEEDINLHWHDFLELEYVTEGDGVQILNQQLVPYSKGKLTLLLPTDFHEVYINKENKPFVYNVKFTEQMLDRDLFDLLYNADGILYAEIPTELHDELVREFLILKRENVGNSILKTKAMKCILQRILIYLVRYMETGDNQKNIKEQSASELSDMVVQVMSYIKRNYRSPITLKNIADSVHLSPNYLSGLFRRNMGITITEYLMSVRMRNAIVYLINSDKTIYEISEAVGYNSYEHFERLFKRRFGISPKEFRQRGALNCKKEIQ